MKRMLINATQPEEVRVAIAQGQTLLDLDIEVPAQEQKKSNIYKARITRVEPSLDACFVEFGSERHGFLSMKEISSEYFNDDAQKQSASGQRVDIKDAVKAGQEIIVQVEKEERGTKGAALTTFISLAGRYLVLMPNNPRAGGVSRQISRDDRKDLLDTLKQINVPDGMGLIVRTAGVGREQEELQWDLDYLLHLWEAIKTATVSRSSPFLIYQESKLIIRALRDYLREDIGEILIDDDDVFEDAREFMQQVMPHNLRKLKAYRDPIPLFSRYQIESQIESAFSREVRLPSGGAVVIDHTEALLSIDINSARATKGADIEETALQTNLEAADEVARQLRIRDLGGLVVIDFIDMMSKDAQRQVENRLRDAMKMDKARVQIGRISRFGLLEMSRQRLRPSLGESSYITCPRCDGMGSIRSIESLALSVLRLAEEEAMKENTARVVIQVPVPSANFLLNEKRSVMTEIEKRNKVPITVVANKDLETPRFEVQRLRSAEDTETPSYALSVSEETESGNNFTRQDSIQPPPAPVQQAAVSGVRPPNPAPARKSEDGFWNWLKAFFAGLFGGSDKNRSDRKKRTSSQASGERGSSGQRSSGKPQNDTNRGNKPYDGNRKKKKKKKKKKKTGSRQDDANQNQGQGQKPDQTNPSDNDPGAQKPRKKRRRRGGKKRKAREAGQQPHNKENQNKENQDKESQNKENQSKENQNSDKQGQSGNNSGTDASTRAAGKGNHPDQQDKAQQQSGGNENRDRDRSAAASKPSTEGGSAAAQKGKDSRAEATPQQERSKPNPAQGEQDDKANSAANSAGGSVKSASDRPQANPPSTNTSGASGGSNQPAAKERNDKPADEQKPTPQKSEKRSPGRQPEQQPSGQSPSDTGKSGSANAASPDKSEKPKAVQGDDGIYRLTPSNANKED